MGIGQKRPIDDVTLGSLFAAALIDLFLFREFVTKRSAVRVRAIGLRQPQRLQKKHNDYAYCSFYQFQVLLPRRQAGCANRRPGF